MTAAASCIPRRERRGGPRLVVILDEAARVCPGNRARRGNAHAPAAHVRRAGDRTAACRRRSRTPAAACVHSRSQYTSAMKQKPGTFSRTRSSRVAARRAAHGGPTCARTRRAAPASPCRSGRRRTARDLHQLGDHRFLRGRIAVVELQRVRPAREVRIASVCQHQIAPRSSSPSV